MCKGLDKSLSSWKQAVLHAEPMAEAAELRARELRKAASTFRELAASGEPFPGGAKTNDRQSKSDGHQP